MKNILFLMVFSVFAFSVTAQEEKAEPLKGKNGQLILPETGDIGLGVNMIPLFNWFGNAFNNNPNNQFADDNKFFTTFGNQVLMGKYFLSEKTALRVNFGFNANSVTNRIYVQDDASNDPLDMVTDTWKNDNGRYTLALGYEMRRGKGRIQGYDGGDLMLNFTNNTNTYSYGNGHSSTNSIPTSSDFGNNLNGNQRVLDNTGNASFGIGVRGFVGVEYFVAPKLSLGCEFGWGIMVENTFKSMVSSEYYEAATGDVMIQNTENAGNTNVNVGVDNLNGAVFMMFYF